RRLKLEIMKVCIEGALLVVVIHLALTKHHMTYAEVEHAGLLARALCLRNIRVAIRGNKDMRHGMVDDDVLEIPLPLKQRDDLDSDAEMIHVHERRRLIRRRAVDHNVIHVHGWTEPRKMNRKI